MKRRRKVSLLKVRRAEKAKRANEKREGVHLLFFIAVIKI